MYYFLDAEFIFLTCFLTVVVQCILKCAKSCRFFVGDSYVILFLWNS